MNTSELARYAAATIWSTFGQDERDQLGQLLRENHGPEFMSSILIELVLLVGASAEQTAPLFPEKDPTPATGGVGDPDDEDRWLSFRRGA